MKTFKRLIALMLVFMMVVSFAGCHKKNEIAVKIGDVEFTSAYYMCALVNADTEAKSKVYETLSDEEKQKEVDYYSKKIDKKGYVEWVEDTAMENLKEIAAYKLLCKENKVELDKDEKSNAEMYASYYWSSYGYSAYFEPNGVGEATYTQYMTDSYYAEAYFEHLYGKEGEKAIADADVNKKMLENFVVANILTASYTSEMKDEEKTALKTKFEKYLDELKNGTRTFEAIYKEYNEVKDEEKEESHEGHDHEANPHPQDEYASIVGAKDTGYDAEYYDTVKAMATGEIKLIELKENAGLVIAVKKDISADPYYLKTLDMTVRHLIADDEYEKIIEDYAKKLKADVNDYAVGQFKVKKIVEPSYN